jgi:hypothetical protein
MKQVIFLGFYCKIYKKNPIAQIYIGDHMIDEIEIPEYYTKDFVKNNQLHYHNKKIKTTFSPGAIYENKTIKHTKIFAFVINDKHLLSSDGVLRIKIKNADSDYTNGFMSNSTLLFLDIFYIFPYAFFENSPKILDGYIDKFLKKSLKKNNLFWPFNLQNYFTLINNKGMKKNPEIFGGDCELKIELKKKYHIWLPKETKTSGYIIPNKFFIKDFVNDFSNKYNK